MLIELGKVGGAWEVSSLFAGWVWGASPKVKCPTVSPRAQSREGRWRRRWKSSGSKSLKWKLSSLSPQSSQPLALPATSTHRASTSQGLSRTTLRALPRSNLLWALTPISRDDVGWRILLITLFFLLLAFYSFSWSGPQELFCLFFLVIVTKNEVTVPLLPSICVKHKPQHFVIVFVFNLVFPNRITSSLVLWPSGSSTADSKSSRSVDGLSGVPFRIHSPCLKFAFPLMHFPIWISFPSICLLVEFRLVFSFEPSLNLSFFFLARNYLLVYSILLLLCSQPSTKWIRRTVF